MNTHLKSIFDSNLTDGEKLLLIYLMDVEEKNFNIIISTNAHVLASKYKFSLRSIYSYLNTLCDNGILYKAKVKSQSNSVYILIPAITNDHIQKTLPSLVNLFEFDIHEIENLAKRCTVKV